MSTLLVASFDNSLDFTDVNGAGTFTAVAPTRYDTVGSADGLWVEESGTQLIINPRCVSFTGWGKSATLTRTLDSVVTIDGLSTQRLYVVVSSPSQASVYEYVYPPAGSVAEGVGAPPVLYPQMNIRTNVLVRR